MRGLALVLLVAATVPPGVRGDEEPLAPPQVELGIENFYYRTAESPLDRGDVLGLGRGDDLLRGTARIQQRLGAARGLVSGFVERRLGGTDATTWTARQAWLQYAWGAGIALKAGKQRIGWGSGFAWNPTNRLEPPKNPLNTGLEQEGVWAARMDWVPAHWVGVILVASRADTLAGDLPFDAGEAPERRSGAVRARFLAKDTDLAVVFSGGAGQRTLVGLDVGREVLGVTAHAEAALYRGAELPPPRADATFFRIATGVLRSFGVTTLTVEYFYNGEGDSDREKDAYLAALEAAFSRSRAEYLAAASRPYSGGMGLRRHYLQAAWSRGASSGKWTLAARATVGLADGGVALTPGAAYAPRGDVSLNLDAILLVGPEGSEYRLAPVRGALQARVKVSF